MSIITRYIDGNEVPVVGQVASCFFPGHIVEPAESAVVDVTDSPLQYGAQWYRFGTGFEPDYLPYDHRQTNGLRFEGYPDGILFQDDLTLTIHCFADDGTYPQSEAAQTLYLYLLTVPNLPVFATNGGSPPWTDPYHMTRSLVDSVSFPSGPPHDTDVNFTVPKGDVNALLLNSAWNNRLGFLFQSISIPEENGVSVGSVASVFVYDSAYYEDYRPALTGDEIKAALVRGTPRTRMAVEVEAHQSGAAVLGKPEIAGDI